MIRRAVRNKRTVKTQRRRITRCLKRVSIALLPLRGRLSASILVRTPTRAINAPLAMFLAQHLGIPWQISATRPNQRDGHIGDHPTAQVVNETRYTANQKLRSAKSQFGGAKSEYLSTSATHKRPDATDKTSGDVGSRIREGAVIKTNAGNATR